LQAVIVRYQSSDRGLPRAVTRPPMTAVKRVDFLLEKRKNVKKQMAFEKKFHQPIIWKQEMEKIGV
jgi:hypothetical protein